MKFLVFSDNVDVSKQLMSFLRGKGEFTLYSSLENQDLLNYGATKVIFLKGAITSDGVSNLVSKNFKEGQFDHIFISSTILGRDVAAHLSVSIQTSVAPESHFIDFKEGNIITKRYGLGGKVVVEEETNSKIATVVPGISDDIPSDGHSDSESIDVPESKVKAISVQPKMTKEVNLEKAGIIVSLGRGIGKKENVERIEPFAKSIGAELAGSRPVCLDYHWLSEDRQVGISGRKVKPKIYIALGISGQIQHIAGMRDSKIVIAINKDKTAPIFQESDYGIVGDLFVILPKLQSLVS